MILIVGLGNPGKKYEKTRHNVGFMVLDKLAETLDVQFKMSEKYNTEIAEATVQFKTKRVRVLLAKPQTFMNNSGEAVAKIVNFYKFRTHDQVWVVHDDLDIGIGIIRIRLSGSSAGQKGIGSILKNLATDKFVRFRIGIKSEFYKGDAEKFVLSKFHASEQKIIDEKITEVIKILKESMDRGVVQTSI